MEDHLHAWNPSELTLILSSKPYKIAIPNKALLWTRRCQFLRPSKGGQELAEDYVPDIMVSGWEGPNALSSQTAP